MRNLLRIANNLPATLVLGALCVSVASVGFLQVVCTNGKPDWCKKLPRPEYKTLQRVLPDDLWFEVLQSRARHLRHLRAASGRRNHFLPDRRHQASAAVRHRHGHRQHQSHRRAPHLAPHRVLNSHTHDDHVGGNWQFPFIYGMDTAFTRASAKGSRQDAQAEIARTKSAAVPPKGFDPQQNTRPSRGKFRSSSKTASK